jgi:hypothetical protein
VTGASEGEQGLIQELVAETPVDPDSVRLARSDGVPGNPGLADRARMASLVSSVPLPMALGLP